MLPVPLTTPVPNNTLPPVMLAVTARLPSVPTEVIFVCAAVCKVPVKLVANMLPVPLTTPDPNMTLPPVTFAVTLTLVPVAAPILGVVSWALDLTMILPDPSNAVVVLSVFALSKVPAIAIPLPA